MRSRGMATARASCGTTAHRFRLQAMCVVIAGVIVGVIADAIVIGSAVRVFLGRSVELDSVFIFAVLCSQQHAVQIVGYGVEKTEGMPVCLL